MSVIMMFTFEADPDRMREVMQSNEETWQAVNARAKEHGAIHHRFVAAADGKTVAVLDEWESEAGFKAFFESSSEIPGLMAQAGVTGPPSPPTFWRAIDTPDAF
jgi:heme-degrading monooxygenase HmoA